MIENTELAIKLIYALASEKYQWIYEEKIYIKYCCCAYALLYSSFKRLFFVLFFCAVYKIYRTLQKLNKIDDVFVCVAWASSSSDSDKCT